MVLHCNEEELLCSEKESEINKLKMDFFFFDLFVAANEVQRKAFFFLYIEDD